MKNADHTRRIVIAANTAWYLYNFRSSTISHLRELGWEVLACCPDGEYSEKLTKLGAKTHHIGVSRKGLNPIGELLTIIQYYRFYKKTRPLIILNFTPKCNIYSSIAAILLRIPFINNISGLGYIFSKGGVIVKIVSLLYRATQRSASSVFFQNNDDLRLFVDSGIVAEKAAIRTFGSGVSLQQFAFSPREQDGIVRCIFVGRLLVEKGVLIFADVARQMMELDERFEFSIVGPIDPGSPSGIDIGLVNSWERQGFLRYLGTSDSVEVILKNQDVVVLPSNYGEGMPKSLLESAAMGKVIITTDTPGCRETVTLSSGYLLRENTVAEIKKFLTDYADLSAREKLEMAYAARAYAEKNFSDHFNISLYEDAIDRAIGNA